MAMYLSYLLPSLRTLLKVLGTTLALSVLGGGTALYLFQTRLIYPANLPAGSREHVPRPQDFGMDGEEVELSSADGTKVKAFVILARDKPEERPTVLLLHANAGNVGHRLPIAKVFWSKMRCNVVMLSYRGYGHSEGSPTEKGIKLDAQTCLDYLKSRRELEKTDVWLYGQSIGGAVAVWLASQNAERVRGLIIENTFLSLPKLIPHLLPFLRPFLPLLLTEIWPSENYITHLPRSFPVLFLAGAKDELVVPGQMRGLWDLCRSERKEWREYEEGTHSESRGWFPLALAALEKIAACASGGQIPRSEFLAPLTNRRHLRATALLCRHRLVHLLALFLSLRTLNLLDSYARLSALHLHYPARPDRSRTREARLLILALVARQLLRISRVVRARRR
ncbi:Alpha/Beta hydrolase fold [Rhodotorula toruloides]|uniref:Alpha/Beta hydrolase fold n=1 Tax=Rhodotorula toruloides TaxID=5286 RepID=A0A2S9ZWQ6_RHOTO|nr:Alpha/Beta hydrolase fold [Rhodotorula toruloides]